MLTCFQFSPQWLYLSLAARTLVRGTPGLEGVAMAHGLTDAILWI